MKQIYCISGLAADHRLFSNLHIEGYELVPMIWLPFNEQDTMSTYAARMAASISAPEPVIIGLSFGGMLATEIGKQYPAWKIFIVSSAKTTTELGYDSGLLRWLSRTGIVPARLFNIPNPVVLYLLGAKTQAERRLLTDIIKDSDPFFMKWCINALLHWNNSVYPQHLIHIHGTKDKVIRSSGTHPHHWIEGGTHIMIYNRGAEIGALILNHLLHN